jgi:hypothetical protein
MVQIMVVVRNRGWDIRILACAGETKGETIRGVGR